MAAALATLAFLIPAWIALVAIALTLEEAGAAVAAALRGQSMAANRPSITVTARYRPVGRPVQSLRPQPALRAAA